MTTAWRLFRVSFMGTLREGHAQPDEANWEPLCQQRSDGDQIKWADREKAVAEWKWVTAMTTVQGDLWRPESSHMTSAPMMSLYADACVRTEYVHEEARLTVHHKQRIIVYVWEALWSGFREHRGTLWKLQQEVSLALIVIDRLVTLTFFFLLLPRLFHSLSHANTQARVTLSASGIRRKKLFFTSAQSLYIHPKKAHEECGGHHWLFVVDHRLHFLSTLVHDFLIIL